jgi:hypothetical protein
MTSLIAPVRRASPRRAPLRAIAAAAALSLLTWTAARADQDAVPALPPPSAPEAPSAPPDVRYRMTDDPADPLRGITTLRVAIAFSAPGAEACQVSTAGLRQAVTQPLAARNLTIVDGRDLEPRAAAAVPEVFVPITVLRDETGVCAASIGVQLGVDTDVVLVHRNLGTPPGTVALSDGYVELDRSATMSLGVPPAFGEQVVATVRDLSAQLAVRIAAANQSGQ